MFWTTIVTHEITFYFTFIFPLSSLFSLLVAPQAWRKSRKRLVLLLLTGPFGAAWVLARPFARLCPPAGGPEPPAIRHRRLLAVVLATWAILVASGLVILFHPGWTAFYYRTISFHSIVGYVSLGLFLAYLLAHLHDTAGRGGWAIGLAGLSLLFLVMYTLNEMTGLSPTSPFLLSFPILPLVYLCFRKAGSRARAASPETSDDALRAGLGLLYLAAFAYFTGVYLEKHASTVLSNNMALYILYIHGESVLILAPLLFSLANFHLSRRWGAPWLARRRFWVFAATLLGVVFVFPYEYKKWSGNSVEWRPDQTTYATSESLPGAPAERTVPAHYAWNLDDSTLCKTDGCHPSLVAQWENSTHRYSADNVIFRRVVELLAAEKGRGAVRDCQLCHDPVGALSPGEEGGPSSERWKQSRGVTCRICHSIIQVDAEHGNGIFRIRTEIPYPVALGDPDWRESWAGFIRSDLRLHFKNYSFPPFYQTAEYCISCHRVTAVKDGKDVMIHDVLGSWRDSPYAAEGVRCRACHMDEFVHDERKILFPDHRFPGLNQALALKVDDPAADATGIAAFERFTEDWVKGKVPGATIKKMGFRKPILGLSLRARGDAQPGGVLEIEATTTNDRVGHDFPVGFKDLNEIWLEVEAVDGSGKSIFHGGKLRPDRTVEPGSPILGAATQHKEGDEIHLHKTQPTPRRQIPPLGKVVDSIRIELPEEIEGPITVRARWNYRRLRQEYVRWFYEGEVTFPITGITEATLTLPLSRDTSR